MATNKIIDGGFTQIAQTQNALIADQGTFVPDLYGSAGALEWDSINAQGRYQRVGNKISVDIVISATDLQNQGSGFLRIGNFPVAANANTFNTEGYVHSDKAINQIRFTGNSTEAILLNNMVAVPVSAISLGANLSLFARIDYWLSDPA